MFGLATDDESGQPSAAEIKIARKNSVGLEFIAHYPKALALTQEENSRLVAFRDAMQETSKLLASHEIPHIYIKFRKLYRYYDSNVDVIVTKEKWQSAIAALQADGYLGHVMFKEPDKIMFSRLGQSVSVHLHPGVTWNGVPYLDEDVLWRDASPSPDGAWLELSENYDLLINLAHNVFENYEISIGDMLYFRRFLRGRSIDEERLRAVAAENGWHAGLLHVLSQVKTLVRAWDLAEQSGHIPSFLLAYPYGIPVLSLARAFAERVAHNVASRHFRRALREVYAYPAFYALMRRHDILPLSR